MRFFSSFSATTKLYVLCDQIGSQRCHCALWNERPLNPGSPYESFDKLQSGMFNAGNLIHKLAVHAAKEGAAKK
jgi:hypothetical protein